MIGTELLKQFTVQTDDQTELSTDEMLSLADNKVKEIYVDTVWEFLRKSATGTFSSGSIDLTTVAPDFLFAMPNYSEDTVYMTPEVPVVYVSDRPYKIIPMGLRGQMKGRDVCWVDSVQNKIVFDNTSLAGTFSFDYQYIPSAITQSSTEILVNTKGMYDTAVLYSMLIDDDIIQKTEKARSNVNENTARFQSIMSKLKSYNAKFILQG